MSDRKLLSKEELVDLLKNGDLKEKEHKLWGEADVPAYLRRVNLLPGDYPLNSIVAHWFYIQDVKTPVNIRRFERVMKKYFKKSGSCFMVDLKSSKYTEKDVENIVKEKISELFL